MPHTLGSYTPSPIPDTASIEAACYRVAAVLSGFNGVRDIKILRDEDGDLYGSIRLVRFGLIVDLEVYPTADGTLAINDYANHLAAFAPELLAQALATPPTDTAQPIVTLV